MKFRLPWAKPEVETVRFVGEIARVALKPGDTLVVTVEHPSSFSSRESMSDYIKRKVPGHPVLILDRSMKLGVLGPQPAEPQALRGWHAAIDRVMGAPRRK